MEDDKSFGEIMYDVATQKQIEYTESVYYHIKSLLKKRAEDGFIKTILLLYEESSISLPNYDVSYKCITAKINLMRLQELMEKDRIIISIKYYDKWIMSNKRLILLSTEFTQQKK